MRKIIMIKVIFGEARSKLLCGGTFHSATGAHSKPFWVVQLNRAILPLSSPTKREVWSEPFPNVYDGSPKISPNLYKFP